MSNIVFLESVSLSIPALSQKEAKALGKKGITKILEEKKKSYNFKYVTLFSGRGGVKISGYHSIPVSVFIQKQEHKTIIPFHEYCHAYYEFSELDDDCSIFIDSDNKAVCFLVKGLVEKYVAGEELKSLKRLLEVVRGMMQEAEARNLKTKIYYDQHIESLSGSIFSYDSDIIKKMSSTQKIKNPYYSMIRSIFGIKVNKEAEEEGKEKEKKNREGNKDVIIYLLFSLTVFNTVVISATSYMIYKLDKQMAVNQDIDYLRSALQNTERNIIEKLKEKEKDDNQSALIQMQRDVRLIKNKVFSRSNNIRSENRAFPPRSGNMPYQAINRDRFDHAKSDRLNLSSTKKRGNPLQDFKCESTVVTDKYVMCDINGDLVKIKAGVQNKVKLKGKTFYVNYSPVQNRIYVKLNPHKKSYWFYSLEK